MYNVIIMYTPLYDLCRKNLITCKKKKNGIFHKINGHVTYLFVLLYLNLVIGIPK